MVVIARLLPIEPRLAKSNQPIEEIEMKRQLSILVLAPLFFVGCAHDLRPASDTRAISVPKDAECSFTPSYRENQNCCVMQPYRTPTDVDTAYARVVGEYDLRPEKSNVESALEANPDIFHGHRHDVRTGDRYELWEIVFPRSDARLGRGVWMGLKLESTGSKSTDVQLVYCELGARAMEDQRTWHRAVQSTIKTTLPPAVER
jgi:hypothetical protein